MLHEHFATRHRSACTSTATLFAARPTSSCSANSELDYSAITREDAFVNEREEYEY